MLKALFLYWLSAF